MEKPELVNRLVLDFLEKDPVPTLMPFRRAPSASGAGYEGKAAALMVPLFLILFAAGVLPSIPGHSATFSQALLTRTGSLCFAVTMFALSVSRDCGRRRVRPACSSPCWWSSTRLSSAR
jgi:hypothetical protein